MSSTEIEDEDPDLPGLISYRLLRSRPVGEWLDEAREAKPPRRLLGDLWLESEICLLFADAGAGKSIFAVQVAEAIARGSNVAPFNLETPPQKVLYFDFELTTAQFAARYSAPEAAESESTKLRTSHEFSPDLIRVALLSEDHDPQDFGFQSFAHYFGGALQDQIEQHEAKVIVIDDITHLSTNIRDARRVTSLMRYLHHIKAELGLSILVLADRRPQRRRNAPVDLADVAAAPPLAAHADSVVAVAPSACGSDIRYLKHLKSRSGELKHDEQNVAVFRLTREKSEATAIAAAPTTYLPPQPPALISFEALVRHQRTNINPRGLAPAPDPALPTPHSAFPHFHPLGTSPESTHLVDPIKQAELAERRERQQLRRAKDLISMLMSPEYKRYLER